MLIMEKAQAGMQYLATYAFMILVAAIILLALYQLGIFSSGTNAARAQPGSCQVYRPNGVFTIQFISLTGLCNGELPEFVSIFYGLGYARLTPTPIPVSANETDTAWMYVNTWTISSQTGNAQNIIETDGGGGPSNGAGTRMAVNKISNHELDFAVWTNPAPGTYSQANSIANTISTNKWYFVAGEYNGSVVSVWINGVLAGTTTGTNVIHLNSATPLTVVGGDSALGGGFFSGYISNIQIYNASLSAGELRSLYIEGIGGAPINLQHLLAWWPLNGNANDYSGDQYNESYITSISYTSQWSGSYTAP